jgi:hypothetical protein
MAAPLPPRISVLLASESPVGIIFRRGPSTVVRVIEWDRDRDRFKPVQWFKGRIFPERSDLSPNGKYMIYFAMGGQGWAIPETGGTWTAISRVPTLTAIALWGQGDALAGGGMFTSNREYWLSRDANTKLIRDTNALREVRKASPPSRLQRDGWTEIKNGRWTACYEKTLKNG